MSKTTDNKIVFKTTDNQAFEDAVQDVIGSTGVSSDTINTNVITSIDSNLMLRHFSTPSSTCVSITPTGANLKCDLTFVPANPLDTNFIWRIVGDDLQLLSSDQAAGLPFVDFLDLPSNEAFRIRLPRDTDTDNTGAFEFLRGGTGVQFNNVFIPNQVDRSNDRVVQQVFNGAGSWNVNLIERNVGGSTVGNYMSVQHRRDGTFALLDNTNTDFATFNVAGSVLTSPLQYTGSAPTNGYVLTTDATGNATWQPSAGGVPDPHSSTHELGGSDQIDHDNLLGYVANEHIDWTNATQTLTTSGDLSIGGSTGTADIGSYQVSSLGPVLTTITQNSIPMLNYVGIGTPSVQLGGAGCLEVALRPNNTNCLLATDTLCTINQTLRYTGDTPVAGSFVQCDANGDLTYAGSSTIDHNGLTNYVANEHIDWTNATEDFKTSSSVTAPEATITTSGNITATADAYYDFSPTGAGVNKNSALYNLSQGGTNPVLFLASHDGRDEVAHFNIGTDQYLTFNSTDFQSTEMTVSVWFNIGTVPGGENYPIYTFSGPAGNYSRAYISNTQNLRIRILRGGASVLLATVVSPALDDNNWHHFVWVQSSSGSIVYLDGVQSALNFSTGNSSTDSTTAAAITDFLIGYHNNGTEFFTGYINEYSIYRRVLSAEDALQLYNEPKGIILKDGNQSNNKVLISDATGVGSWYEAFKNYNSGLVATPPVLGTGGVPFETNVLNGTPSITNVVVIASIRGSNSIDLGGSFQLNDIDDNSSVELYVYFAELGIPFEASIGFGGTSVQEILSGNDNLGGFSTKVELFQTSPTIIRMTFLKNTAGQNNGQFILTFTALMHGTRTGE